MNFAAVFLGVRFAEVSFTSSRKLVVHHFNRDLWRRRVGQAERSIQGSALRLRCVADPPILVEPFGGTVEGIFTDPRELGFSVDVYVPEGVEVEGYTGQLDVKRQIFLGSNLLLNSEKQVLNGAVTGVISRD